MTYTRAQLVEQALIDLGVIAEGQSVSPNDSLKMDGYVDAAMSELTDLDIYYVSDFGQLGPTGGAIEPGAFLSLALYLANAATSGFNLPADEKMAALEMQAIAKLRTLARPPRAAIRSRIDPALRGSNRGVYAKFPNNG
jgi:hypothetical protein